MENANRFEALADEVKKQARAAAVAAYIAGANRAIGRIDTRIVQEAQHKWDTLFDTVDETYGVCGCGHGIPCQSLDQHALCAEFVEQVEEYGESMTRAGFAPTPEIIEQGMRIVANDLSS